MDEGEPQLHKPTARVLDSLEAISGNPRGCTLTDISQAIGAPKSTLVPVLRTMERKGFIALDPETSRYTVGIRAFAVGSTFSEGDSLISLIKKEMEALVRSCSETCQLGVLEGGNVFYVAKVDSPEPIRMISSIGTRVPAYCSAIGKALLSDYTEEGLKSLYPGKLKRLTSHTVSTISELEEMIEAQRERGLFEEREESTMGLACFAVPLRRGSAIVAAASVSVPLFRLDSGKRDLVVSQLAEFRVRGERILSSYTGEGGLLALK